MPGLFLCALNLLEGIELAVLVVVTRQGARDAMENNKYFYSTSNQIKPLHLRALARAIALKVLLP